MNFEKIDIFVLDGKWQIIYCLYEIKLWIQLVKEGNPNMTFHRDTLESLWEML